MGHHVANSVQVLDLRSAILSRMILTRAMLRLVMPADQSDEVFMRAALIEAKKGLGLTSPNPAVGAVLVRNSQIIARGHHRKAGEPHAEIDCLNAVGGRPPKGSAL